MNKEAISGNRTEYLNDYNFFPMHQKTGCGRRGSFPPHPLAAIPSQKSVSLQFRSEKDRSESGRVCRPELILH